MRISATGFARIGDNQGRIALLVNKGRLTRGKGRILSPIGGGLEYTPIGRTLLEALGATDFEGDRQNPAIPDLRFRVPDDQVENVVTWFRQRQHRETTVFRETAEELTRETRVLTLGNLRGYREGYAGFFRYDAVTIRDVPEKQTAYLIETFDVTLSDLAMRVLKAAARVDIGRRWVYFVTPAEIENGVTNDGVDIGPISKFVV